MRKRFISILSALAFALSALFIGATPASAAMNISVTIGDHNCRRNQQYEGSISRILVDVVPSSSGQPGWISGRTRYNITIPTPSSQGSAHTIAAVVFCKTSIFGTGYYRELTFGKWATNTTPTNWNF